MTPVEPRPAATVMVVRDAEPGLEVYMVRRHQASGFAADLYVFPGGTIRPDDVLPLEAAPPLGLDPGALRAALERGGDPFAEREDGGLALWVAALRELFEEAGLLLAEVADGRLVDLSAPTLAAQVAILRGEVQRGSLSLAELARRLGLRLAADRLIYFSRWITPLASPRRYDTRFFVAEVPSGQQAGHCQIETTDGLWLAPAAALARHARGELPLMFPTREHLRRLAPFRRVAELLAFARGKEVRPVLVSVDPERGPYLTPEQWPW